MVVDFRKWVVISRLYHGKADVLTTTTTQGCCNQQLYSDSWMLRDDDLLISYHTLQATKMAITILPPPPPPADYDDSDISSDESEDGGVALDNDGDLDMRPKKRARHGGESSIVTPGEVVTDDPQWMRFVFSACASSQNHLD